MLESLRWMVVVLLTTGALIGCGKGGESDATGETDKASREAVQKGLDLLAKGDWEGAQEQLTISIEADDNNVDAYAARGRARYRLNQLQDAQKDCDRALTLAPRNTEALFLKAVLHRERGDTVAAMDACDAALAVDGKCASALAMRGLLRSENGSSSGALRDIEAAIELAPDAPTVRVLAAAARYELHDFPGGWKDASHVLKSAPNHAEALLIRGMCRYRTGMNPTAAMADMQKAIDCDKYLWRAHDMLARIHHFNEDYKRTAYHLETALDLGGRPDPGLLGVMRPHLRKRQQPTTSQPPAPKPRSTSVDVPSPARSESRAPTTNASTQPRSPGLDELLGGK